MSSPPLEAQNLRPWRLAAGFGALGAVVAYVGTTIVGGLIVPGYSHVSDSVSSLTSPGGAYSGALALGFAAYNVGVVLLGVSLPRLTAARSGPLRIAGGLLVACGVAGVLMLRPFPQDPMGAELTPPGIVHIVLAGISAVALVAATVLSAVAWRKDPYWSRLWLFSVVVAGAIVVTGGVGAAFITSPVFGLLERSTQVSFLSWFAAVGILALRMEPPARPIGR